MFKETPVNSDNYHHIIKEGCIFSFDKEAFYFISQLSLQSHIVIVYCKEDFNIKLIIYYKV